MNLKLPIISALVCCMLFSCGGKGENSYSSPENTDNKSIGKGIKYAEMINLPESNEVLKAKFKDIPEAETGAVISISDTAVSAGETAEVTVSLKGADLGWNMCGIHLTFPDKLKCVRKGTEGRDVKCKKGTAVEYNTGFIAVEWVQNRPEELLSQNLGSLFFTTMFDGDGGQDGDIATFYFEVPKDAESGTVYPIGYYFMESDIFRNSSNDESFEKYAFENWQTGSITVK